MEFNYKDCERLIGYEFKDKSLLINAFTHSSYTNEHKDFSSNERLEFLGDSILGFVITEALYQTFPFDDEGDLTLKKQALVSKTPLSNAIIKAWLDKFLILGEGERYKQNKINLAENLFEAIVAVIYLDGGIEPTKKFIFSHLNIKEVKIEEQKKDQLIDYKSRLLYHVQKEKLGDIDYFEVSRTGPSHKPTFVMAVKVGNKVIATAQGSSHKEGEKLAAKSALKILQSEENVLWILKR